MSKGEFSGLGRNKNKDVDAFVESATADGKPKLDARAKRDYKGIRLGFNQYEYELLTEAAAEANLSLVAFVRTSWMNRAQGK